MVAVLFNAGDHVPVILLLEVVGNADKLSPLHIATTCVKLGVIFAFTVTVTEVLAGEVHAIGISDTST